MPLKRKLIFIAVLAVCFTAFNLKLPAVLADNGALPEPPNTELTKKESRKIVGSEFTFYYYTSSQGISEIMDFYRGKLPALGWKEKDVLKELNTATNQQADSSLENFFTRAFMFEKDNQTLSINFMPPESSRDKKTYFSLSKGALNLQPGQAEDIDFIPELLTKPKKDVAPVYPGAALVILSEEATSLRATYSSKDNIDAVLEFYRQKAPDYGWNLVEEKPLNKVDLESAQAPCPSCSAGALDAAKNTEVSYAEMIFTNARQDSLRLGFSRLIFNKGSQNNLDFTSIMVEYAQKKK